MILGNSNYRIVKNFVINEEHLSSLFYLYVNLVGNKALNLYLFLSFSFKQRTHSHLFKRLEINRDDFLIQREKLEEYGLLKVYYNSDKDFYIYEIYPPLKYDVFVKSVFSRKILLNMEQDDIQFLKRNYADEDIPSGFNEITKKINLDLIQNWTNKEEKIFKNVLNKNDEYEKYGYKFYIDELIKITSNIIFPISLRNDENLNEIARMGTIYGISPKNMNKYLADVTDFEKQELDLKRLLKKCKDSNIFEHKKVENVYFDNCINFLVNLTNTKISQNEKRIIDVLSKQYGFETYIINCLLEYVLKKNDNRMNERYIYTIADTIKRRKVDSLEKLQKMLEDSDEKNKIKYKKEKDHISVDYEQEGKDENLDGIFEKR